MKTRRVLTLVLALLLLVSIAGCSGAPESAAPESTAPESTAPESAAEIIKQTVYAILEEEKR